MSFAQELLDQAFHLLKKDGANPNGASLRRAVSTAYYAVFHLLIDEVVSYWGIPRQRATLARTFEHRTMLKVCQECVKDFYKAKEPPALLPLKEVAEAFSQLQQIRHTADYDNAFVWTSGDAEEWIGTAYEAFQTWRSIRETPAAQDFLLNLFLPKQPRQ